MHKLKILKDFNENPQKPKETNTRKSPKLEIL
jgi:hypothetical protein